MPGPLPATELKRLEHELEALRAENARLRRQLNTQRDAAPALRRREDRLDRIRTMLHDNSSRNP